MRRKDLDQSLIREYLTEALLQLMEKKNYDDSSSLRQKGSDTFDESGPCLGDFAGRPEGLF